MRKNRTRPQQLRIKELHLQIKNRKYPNCSSFSKQWEVSEKTIQRDIEYLRDSLGAPIEYDFKKQGYRYLDDNWCLSLPDISMTDGELLALLFSSKAMQVYSGAPLGDEMNRISEKMMSALQDDTSIPVEYFGECVSFALPATHPVKPAIWVACVRAITEQHVLRISGAFATESCEAFSVQPHHLANIKGEWYIFATPEGEAEIVQYPMKRIVKARVTKQSFEAKCDIDFPEVVRSSFGRCVYFDEHPLHSVRLLFVPQLKRNIEGHTFGLNQRILTREDGAVELSFQTRALMEVFWWVLKWGHGVKVLAPDVLVELHRQEIDKMVRLYESDAPPQDVCPDLLDRMYEYVESRL